MSPASRPLSDALRARFDADKVARVAQAIADGRFEIDPQAIADKLIVDAPAWLLQALH